MFTWNEIVEKGHLYFIAYMDFPSVNHFSTSKMMHLDLRMKEE